MLTVGVLVGNISSEHSIQLIDGIVSRAQELNIQVIAFLGLHTNDFYQVVFQRNAAHENYDYQCNVIYSYAALCHLDAMIISSGTIGIFLDGKSMEEFLACFGEIPIVLAEETSKFSRCSTIICDNYQGVYELTKHLIERHGCRNLVTLAGPRINTDAIQRVRGFCDALLDHGLPFENGRIEYGDYSEAVEPQVENLLRRYPDLDAIVCANDSIAKTTCRVCAEHGLKPGVDVKITGFDDDSNIATCLNPTLTTVRQNVFAMGRAALEMAVPLAKGHAPKHQTDPVEVIFRASCGCPDTLDREYYRIKLADLSHRSKRFQQTVWFTPLITRTLLDSVNNEEKFYRVIADKLEEISCSHAWLLMLKSPIPHAYAEEWTCPDKLNVLLSLSPGEKHVYRRGSCPEVTVEHGIDLLGFEDGKTCMSKFVFPIFSGRKQRGILVADLPLDQFPFLYLTLQQVENAMDFLDLNRTLEEKNAVLSTISSRDPMTNALNRRGLTEVLVTEMGIRPGTRMRIFIADLDHLKQINDLFGHGEGDSAIMTLTQAFREALPEDGLVSARIGGDEFLLFDAQADLHDPAEEMSRIRSYLSDYNRVSGKPYYVEVSLGYTEFTAEPEFHLNQILNQADQYLYEAKKIRRQNICKVARSVP